MENATKALLIAAAILIAIVLVSIGVFVLRQGQDAMGSVNMNESEIMAFNARINTYEGTIRGSNVKSLYSRVKLVNNDLRLKGAAPIHWVGIGEGDAWDGFSTASYYTVDMNSKDSMGLITHVRVAAQGQEVPTGEGEEP